MLRSWVNEDPPGPPLSMVQANRTARDHALPDTVLFVARHIDDFAAYTGYKIVDPGDHRSWQV